MTTLSTARRLLAVAVAGSAMMVGGQCAPADPSSQGTQPCPREVPAAPLGAPGAIPVAASVKPADASNSLVLTPSGSPGIICGATALTTYRDIAYAPSAGDGRTGHSVSMCRSRRMSPRRFH
jgi:hypothetical protein